MRKKLQVIIGERFGKGVVIGKNEEFSIRNKKTYVDMICDCGTKYCTAYSSIKRLACRSCGCLKTERMKGVRNIKHPRIFATYEGKTLSLLEWSKITGINLRTLYTRYTTYGYRGDELFSTNSLQTGKKLSLTTNNKTALQ